MTGDELLDVMGHIDPELIAEADVLPKRQQTSAIRLIAALAAMLAVLIGIAFLMGKSPNGPLQIGIGPHRATSSTQHVHASGRCPCGWSPFTSASCTRPATSHKEEPEKITDMVVEENGIPWLILPISHKKINVDDEQHYLEKIDPAMLRAAEEKLLDRMDNYTLEIDSSFHLSSHDGQIWLCMELIISLDPRPYPTDPSYTGPTVPQEGCGIDHDHLLFSEPISNP